MVGRLANPDIDVDAVCLNKLTSSKQCQKHRGKGNVGLSHGGALVR